MRQQPIDRHHPPEAWWIIASAASRFVSQDREQDIKLLARSRRQIAESRLLLAMPVLRLGPLPLDKDR